MRGEPIELARCTDDWQLMQLRRHETGDKASERVELVEPCTPEAWDLWFRDSNLCLVSIEQVASITVGLTPQKRAKTMMIGGLSNMAMKVLGVSADTIWARVTEKTSATSTMKKL